MPGKETDALLQLQGSATNQDDYDDDQHEPQEDPEFHEEATNMFARMKAAVADVTASTRIAGREAIQQEVGHVKDAWKDHLMEINDGEGDFFLTMSLTKNLSLLPSKPEIVQAEEEILDAVMLLRRKFSAIPGVAGEAEPIATSTTEMARVDEKENPEAAPPLSAYLILGSAVCALSSIGPFLAKQGSVNPCMKIVWRFQGTAILLAPLAIRSGFVDGWPKLTPAQWVTFACASASYSVLCVAFAMSINYTTVSNATILTNSQSVLLVAAKLLMGHHVLFLEGFGVAVAFLGGILCARESAELDGAPAHGWWSVWGDVLGLISSVGGIGYIILGKSLRSSMSVLFFMVLNMATASFIILLYMWTTRIKFTWNRDIDIGVFGWINGTFDRFPLEMMTVFVCNCLGTMGYVRAFKYFSSVIIAVAALLEPVVASFTAVFMGVGVLPGVEGWIGNFLVAAGTLAVLYPSTLQGAKEQQETKKKVIPTPRTPYPRMRTPRLTPRGGIPPHLMRKLAEQQTDRSLLRKLAEQQTDRSLV